MSSCPALKLVEHPPALVGNRLGQREERHLGTPSTAWLIAAEPGRPRLSADDFASFVELVKVVADLSSSSAEQLRHTGGGGP